MKIWKRDHSDGAKKFSGEYLRWILFKNDFKLVILVCTQKKYLTKALEDLNGLQNNGELNDILLGRYRRTDVVAMLPIRN